MGFVDEAVRKLYKIGVSSVIAERDAHCILGMNVMDSKGTEKLRKVINGRPVILHEDTPTLSHGKCTPRG